jgi:hypothetical protein
MTYLIFYAIGFLLIVGVIVLALKSGDSNNEKDTDDRD